MLNEYDFGKGVRGKYARRYAEGTNMSDFLARTESYQDDIREVLMREWDPIGVAGVPEAQDEYDQYINQIYGMLIRREPKYKLVDFLWWAETKNMSLYGNRKRTDKVADLLLHLIEQTGSKAEPPISHEDSPLRRPWWKFWGS